ncbi:MAG: hypothetical protein VYB61_10425 [Verrucomicrobiota bacterium]|nr:hypothetical protein [Verrucomicrobiota bacterium]
MFAGAAREVVFSNPEVITRVGREFIPVALKAANVQNPPPGKEGEIYKELLRTQPAPQGICTMNSAGKVITWSLSFDNQKSVLQYLSHARKRFADAPDIDLDAERFRRFPSVQLPDVPANGRLLQVPNKHRRGDQCPGELRMAQGSLKGSILGRAFDSKGKPLQGTRSQDNYVEDTLEITANMQRELLQAARNANGRFLLPDSLAREFVANAYLGMLDVNPLGGDGVRAELLGQSIKFWAEKNDGGRLTISGSSKVNAKNREGLATDAGRKWTHLVELQWHGFIDLKLEDQGIREILLSASGNEQLKWGGPGSGVSPDAANNPVAHLPSGRWLDISSPVRYWISARQQ